MEENCKIMGFLGFGNFNKEGPGVPKETPPQKRIVSFFEIYFRKFWNIIKINLLYVIFCIPIVTIGPATAGMTYVLRNYAREEHAFVFGDFWDAFKSNFKQSFITGILQAILLFVFYYVIAFYYLNLSAGTMYYICLGISLFFVMALLFASNYIYLMIVTLDLKLKDIYKNGLIFAFVGLKENLFTLLGYIIVIGIPLLILLFAPIEISIIATILLVAMLVPATLIFISCFNSYPVIKKYCIDPYNKRIEEDNVTINSDVSDINDKIFNDSIPVKEE